MIKRLFFLSILIFLAGCTTFSPTAVDSGIEGQVRIGPTCPVVRVGMDCADKPFQADFIVQNKNGREILRFSSDAQGLFKVPLDPGDYNLHPVLTGVMPHAADQPFSVISGQFTHLDVQFDSGIR